MIRKVELLAPARNLECAREAVKHGADAVYMGANRFGARSAAGNTLNDIEQAVLYAHRYGARVFITMNTLLFDSELEEAVRMAHELYNVGADALIIQDIRLLYLRRHKVLPPLPIHASTQMDNASGDKVLYLEREGFDSEVIDALRLLTHSYDQLYVDYILNIRTNLFAREVKLADLRDNMQDLRPSHQLDKYKMAEKILLLDSLP